LTPWRIEMGDCLDLLRELPADSVDAVVTDPPYELNFMGRDWDNAGVSFRVETWRAVLRVLRPGGYLLAFGGTRTYHRIVCAIEDAGFEVRDSIHWVYGTGFPKGQNVGKTAGPEWAGWNTALKPAHEPVVLARKPLAEPTVAKNVLAHGVGALNIDGCRVPGASEKPGTTPPSSVGGRRGSMAGAMDRVEFDNTKGRWPPNLVLTHSPECRRVGERKVKAAAHFTGDGGGARPGGFVDTGAETGSDRPSGASHADGDGLETVAAYECEEGCPVAALDRQSGHQKSGIAVQRHGGGQKIGTGRAYHGSAGLTRPDAGYADEGGASRFFPAFEWDAEIDAPFLYCAKASRRERTADGAMENRHPTVKPIALMRWLCRLVTPPGGLVLDPFCGSGSTGVAAVLERFRFVGFEQEEASCETAAGRLQRACPKIERRAMGDD
jgi:site-specific DNA-methyltransferase (adenine-specific)